MIGCSVAAICMSDQNVQSTRLLSGSALFTMQTRTDEPSSHHKPVYGIALIAIVAWRFTMLLTAGSQSKRT